MFEVGNFALDNYDSAVLFHLGVFDSRCAVDKFVAELRNSGAVAFQVAPDVVYFETHSSLIVRLLLTVGGELAGALEVSHLQVGHFVFEHLDVLVAFQRRVLHEAHLLV